MRPSTAIFPLLVAGLVTGQQNDKYTLLSTRVLANGRELHSIQEHGDELPELPEDDEEVMVPVDDNGNVLPGYEHLLEPRVVLLNREDIQKLNNSKPVNTQTSDQENDLSNIPPSQGVPLVLPPNSKVLQSNDIDQETEGTDYDEAIIPDSRLPTVQDYVDSKEKDPEVETAEDLEKDLKKIQKEIEELKEKVEKEEAEPTMSSAEVAAEVSAIVEGAQKEMNKTGEDEGLREFIKEIVELDEGIGGDDDEEEKEAVEERTTVRMAEEVKPTTAGQVKEEGKKEGYVLDTTSLEQTEDERRPSRLHKGEILGRRRPDSTGSLSLLPPLVFSVLFFI